MLTNRLINSQTEDVHSMRIKIHNTYLKISLYTNKQNGFKKSHKGSL